MLINFLTTTMRNLLRQKTNTATSLIGLTLGLTCSLILFLIIIHGNSFDTYHQHRDRIFRIVTQSKGNNGINYTQGVPVPLAEAVKNDFPQVEESVLTSYHRDNLIAAVQPDRSIKKFEEPTGVVFTGTSFFKIFDRMIIAGSKEKLLDQPGDAVISKMWAMKFYGDENVIGRVLQYDGAEYTIEAVMENVPTNTDLPFELMLSSVTIRNVLDQKNWGDLDDNKNCYVLLKSSADVATMEAAMPAFINKYLGSNSSNDHETSFILQPLRILHFDMRFGNYNTRFPKMVQRTYVLIAIFFLITSSINFVNLTTAEAIKRLREVGIRKVLGSSRKELVIQFFGEALFLTVLSTIISLAVIQVALPFLNSLMEMSLTLVMSGSTLVMIIGITIFMAMLSGLYPAILISSFKPVLALKNQLGNNVGMAKGLRKGLVVFQFFICQLFIFCTMLLMRQMEFIQKQDIGFEKEAIINLPIPEKSNIRTFKNEILGLPGVEQASLNFSAPSHKAVIGTSFTIAGGDQQLDTQVKPVDGDYIDLFGIALVEGVKLEDRDTVYSVVVNEKFVADAGFKNNIDIIGEELDFWGKLVPVIGVVKNFNTTSLDKPLEAVMLVNDVNSFQNMAIRIKPTDMQETIANIKVKWENAFPEYIFKYTFMDQQIKDLYKGEQRITAFLKILTLITIVIGCLGLFGLVSYMANHMRKEIGVRKVHGASNASIILLFTNEFAKLILIGFVLATPIAWYFMNIVLNEFAYKTPLGPMIFISGLGVTAIIVILTVGFRSYKASTTNPVGLLKSGE